MFTAIQTIGMGLVLVLCAFAITIIYYLFRGGIKEADEAERSIGNRILDRTAWGMNGLACLWMVLRHRRRLYRYVGLSFAGEAPVAPNIRYEDTGEEMTLMDGMVVVSYLFPEHPEGRVLYVRRPFEFLGRDWLESMGVRKDDGRVT